jgi:hypothetical protein
MIRRILLAGLAAVLAAGAVGCRHCCKRGSDLPPMPPPGAYIPPPPGGLPSTPPAGAASDLPPPSIPDATRGYRPDFTPPGGPKLILPDPLPPGTSSSSGRRLGNPTGDGDLPPRQISPARRAESGNTVAGVPGFSAVKPGQASGRKPAVEGFDALKAGGYRTAIYLHAPGDDVSATKDLAEKSGLTFVGIPTSAGNVKDAFERFRDTIGEAANRPAFVFDDDGIRAGGMWYLHFRTAEQLGDDTARVRAAPLGLREDGEEAAKFWAAIQDYLAKR